MTPTDAKTGTFRGGFFKQLRPLSWIMIILLCLTLTGCSSCSDDDDDNDSSSSSSDNGSDDSGDTDDTGESDDTGVWATQLLGIADDDLAYAVTTDSSGNIYITGDTEGDLNGETNAGERDVFVAKYNSSGTIQWLKLLGTAESEGATAIAVDADLNVYITGYTRGALNGETNSGGNDIFTAKYGSSGTLQWVELLGTEYPDQATAIALDSSANVYVTGSTEGDLNSQTNAGASDMFIAEYNTSGVLKWAYLLGTDGNEQGNGIAVDSSSDVFITGYTNGDLNGESGQGGYDIVTAEYNASGSLQWVEILGTDGNEQGNAIIADSSSNIYITGSSSGDLNSETNAGEYDIFTAEYDSTGDLQWLELLGTEDNDEGRSLALDSAGNVIVTGYTAGDLDQETNAGEEDVFVAEYGSTGTLGSVTLIGTTAEDMGTGIAIDSSDNVYVTGRSEGAFDGATNAGDADAFIYLME